MVDIWRHDVAKRAAVVGARDHFRCLLKLDAVEGRIEKVLAATFVVEMSFATESLNYCHVPISGSCRTGQTYAPC